MNIERQEERIRAILEEAAIDSSDESSSEQETDHCSEHEVNSDTEQEGDDKQEEAVVNESGDDPADDLPLSLLREF